MDTNCLKSMLENITALSKENGLLTFFEDDLCAEKSEEGADDLFYI